MHRFLQIALNLVIILSVSACGQANPTQPASSLTGETPIPATPAATRALVTTADLTRVATGLPADPAEAALKLAQMVYQADMATAQAAAGELLRRAGVPLVATDGPVIGWPDDRVLVDAEVYVDFLPQIVNSLRLGDFYTPSQVAELLAGIFQAEQALPPDMLVAFLAAWGKDPGDPLELRSAGAAARALAAQRGQVFYPQADPTMLHIDQLTLTLLLAQITSADRQRNQASLPGGLKLASLRRAPALADSPCEALLRGLKPEDPNADLVSGFLQKKLVDDIKAVLSYERDAKGNVMLDRRGNPIENETRKKAADRVVQTYNITMKMLSLYLLMMGATIKLEANQSTIHYHHPGGGHAGAHVILTATAVFASTLTKQQVTCYALAGLEIPPGGPMGEGFKIRWNVDQERADGLMGLLSGKHVTTTTADSHKIYACGSCSDPTNAEGQSTLELYTRTEPNPGGVGEEQEGSVNVTAKLDVTDFPFKPSDFIITSESDANEFAGLKTLDLVLSALKRATLPAAEKTLKVTYHAPSIYVAKGVRVLPSFIYYDLPVSVDLYTCSGLTGPWQGQASFGTQESILGAAMRPLWGQVFGRDLPPPGDKISEPASFKIEPGGTNWVPLLTAIQLYGKMKLYPYEANYYKKYGKPPPHGTSGLTGTTLAGTIEVYLAGHSFADFEELGAAPFEIFIEAADADPRCPSGEATFVPE